MRVACSWKDQFFFFLLKIDFGFASLQAFWKKPCEIERLHSAEMYFSNMLAPSSRNQPESLSTPVALKLSIFVIICKIFSSDVLLKHKLSEIVNTEIAYYYCL